MLADLPTYVRTVWPIATKFGAVIRTCWVSCLGVSDVPIPMRGPHAPKFSTVTHLWKMHVLGEMPHYWRCIRVPISVEPLHTHTHTHTRYGTEQPNFVWRSNR